VYVVAITELSAAIDVEAPALATDLGVTAYEARLVLAPGTPAIVRVTPDKALASDLLARLRARGHGAVACDMSAVVASTAMTSMRRFRLGPTVISLDDRPGDELSYDRVIALIAAAPRQRTTSESEGRQRELSIGRAVLTGGIVTTRTVTRETRAATEQREPVLYVFRRGGGNPWILREHGTSWAGHGGPMAPSASDNFRIAVDLIRQRAPDAPYDARLVARKSIPERMAVSGGAAGTTTTISSDKGTDLLAHLVALWITRRQSIR
jgi:hypothetical protein